MKRRVPALGSCLVMCAVLFASTSTGQTVARTAKPAPQATPRTPWNVPDLQGRWTTATATPLQRPPEFAGKEFFSGNEAAEYGLANILKATRFTDAQSLR